MKVKARAGAEFKEPGYETDTMPKELDSLLHGENIASADSLDNRYSDLREDSVDKDMTAVDRKVSSMLGKEAVGTSKHAPATFGSLSKLGLEKGAQDSAVREKIKESDEPFEAQYFDMFLLKKSLDGQLNNQQSSTFISENLMIGENILLQQLQQEVKHYGLSNRPALCRSLSFDKIKGNINFDTMDEEELEAKLGFKTQIQFKQAKALVQKTFQRIMKKDPATGKEMLRKLEETYKAIQICRSGLLNAVFEPGEIQGHTVDSGTTCDGLAISAQLEYKTSSTAQNCSSCEIIDSENSDKKHTGHLSNVKDYGKEPGPDICHTEHAMTDCKADQDPPIQPIKDRLVDHLGTPSLDTPFLQGLLVDQKIGVPDPELVEGMVLDYKDNPDKLVQPDKGAVMDHEDPDPQAADSCVENKDDVNPDTWFRDKRMHPNLGAQHLKEPDPVKQHLNDPDPNDPGFGGGSLDCSGHLTMDSHTVILDSIADQGNEHDRVNTGQPESSAEEDCEYFSVLFHELDNGEGEPMIFNTSKTCCGHDPVLGNLYLEVEEERVEEIEKYEDESSEKLNSVMAEEFVTEAEEDQDGEKCKDESTEGVTMQIKCDRTHDRQDVEVQERCEDEASQKNISEKKVEKEDWKQDDQEDTEKEERYQDQSLEKTVITEIDATADEEDSPKELGEDQNQNATKMYRNHDRTGLGYTEIKEEDDPECQMPFSLELPFVKSHLCIRHYFEKIEMPDALKFPHPEEESGKPPSPFTVLLRPSFPDTEHKKITSKEKRQHKKQKRKQNNWARQKQQSSRKKSVQKKNGTQRNQGRGYHGFRGAHRKGKGQRQEMSPSDAGDEGGKGSDQSSSTSQGSGDPGHRGLRRQGSGGASSLQSGDDSTDGDGKDDPPRRVSRQLSGHYSPQPTAKQKKHGQLSQEDFQFVVGMISEEDESCKETGTPETGTSEMEQLQRQLLQEVEAEERIRRRQLMQEFDSCFQICLRDENAQDCQICTYLISIFQHFHTCLQPTMCRSCCSFRRILQHHLVLCGETIAGASEESGCGLRLCGYIQELVQGCDNIEGAVRELSESADFWNAVQRHIRKRFPVTRDTTAALDPDTDSLNSIQSMLGSFNSVASIHNFRQLGRRLASQRRQRVRSVPSFQSIPEQEEIPSDAEVEEKIREDQEEPEDERSAAAGSEVSEDGAVLPSDEMSRVQSGPLKLRPRSLWPHKPSEQFDNGFSTNSLRTEDEISSGHLEMSSVPALPVGLEPPQHIGAVRIGTMDTLEMYLERWQNMDSSQMLSAPQVEGILFRWELHLNPDGTYIIDRDWYEIQPLGRGMTGSCVLGVDATDCDFRFCAKKERLEKFNADELRIQAMLVHHMVPRLYGVVREGEEIIIFMEYIEGETLTQLIERHEHLNARTTMVYIQQLLEFLVYLQEKRVLHEDLKADNIIVRAGTIQLMVIDYNVATRIPENQATTPGGASPMGAQIAWSPEKARSEKYDIRSEVWAVMCLAIHMLSGSPPWVQRYGQTLNNLHFVIGINPPPICDIPNWVPQGLRLLIERGLVPQAERPLPADLLLDPCFQTTNEGNCNIHSGIVESVQQHLEMVQSITMGPPSVSIGPQSGAMTTQPITLGTQSVAMGHQSVTTGYESRLSRYQSTGASVHSLQANESTGSIRERTSSTNSDRAGPVLSRQMSSPSQVKLTIPMNNQMNRPPTSPKVPLTVLDLAQDVLGCGTSEHSLVHDMEHNSTGLPWNDPDLDDSEMYGSGTSSREIVEINDSGADAEAAGGSYDGVYIDHHEQGTVGQEIYHDDDDDDDDGDTASLILPVNVDKDPSQTSVRPSLDHEQSIYVDPAGPLRQFGPLTHNIVDFQHFNYNAPLVINSPSGRNPRIPQLPEFLSTLHTVIECPRPELQQQQAVLPQAEASIGATGGARPKTRNPGENVHRGIPAYPTHHDIGGDGDQQVAFGPSPTSPNRTNKHHPGKTLHVNMPTQKEIEKAQQQKNRSVTAPISQGTNPRQIHKRPSEPTLNTRPPWMYAYSPETTGGPSDDSRGSGYARLNRQASSRSERDFIMNRIDMFAKETAHSDDGSNFEGLLEAEDDLRVHYGQQDISLTHNSSLSSSNFTPDEMKDALASILSSGNNNVTGNHVRFVDENGRELMTFRITMPTTQWEEIIKTSSHTIHECGFEAFTAEHKSGRPVSLVDSVGSDNTVVVIKNAQNGGNTWQWRMINNNVEFHNSYNGHFGPQFDS